ncbi:ABC transporter ATP-binding protein [Alsobacter sp. R-9]
MSDVALAVRDLTVEAVTRDRRVTLVDGISLAVGRGEILAVVGESGSGKSMTALAVMGLLEPPVRIASGGATLAGRLIDPTDRRAMRAIRGRDMAMIFQDPMMTLNPVMRIDEQVCEAVTVHDPSVSRAEALRRAREALVTVGIPAPDERLAAYPHQLSGGTRQRIVIAIALINRPAVVLADEPTTALDVTTQGQILHEAKRLCRETGTAMVWITHDLAVVASLADSIAVMYAGRIVEQGPAERILSAPLHPYTRGLLDSVPMIDTKTARLRSIPGMPPVAGSITAGCRFAPRCGRVVDACRTAEPALVTSDAGDRLVRCLRPLEPAGEAG